MPGVHRLEHVERFAAADLAHDDPIRPHAKRVPHEFTHRDLAAPLDVGGARLERDHVWLGETQLGGVLDRDEAFVVGDEPAQHAEERRLAAAGPAADDQVDPPTDGGLEEAQHPRP